MTWNAHGIVELVSGFVDDGGGYYAAAGDTVSFTVTPEEGYALETLTVKQGETELAAAAGENGAYSFTMPAGDVTVRAIFSAIPTGPIIITQQPADAQAALGEIASTTVVAEGEGLKYQWYGREANGREFKSGLKGDTYSVAMAKSKIGRVVWCVITGKYGNSVTSETATLTMEG